MTLVEFVSPLSKGKHQDRLLAVMYFLERYENKGPSTVEELRQGLRRARARDWAKVNVAGVLSRSGALVDTSGVQGNKRLWELTDTGRSHVRELLDLPEADVEVEQDVGTLEALTAKITDADVKGYLEEAIRCLQVGARRACIVFLWAGAIRTLQQRMMGSGKTALTTAIQRHDPKARAVSRVDDFAHVKDSLSLLAAKDLGVIDKGQKDTLTEALNLRNRCGHPGKYRPGTKKVAAFVEDVTTILWPETSS